MPFAHRLCRKSPKVLRMSVTIMVDKRKNRYYSMKGLSDLWKDDALPEFGPFEINEHKAWSSGTCT